MTDLTARIRQFFGLCNHDWRHVQGLFILCVKCHRERVILTGDVPPPLDPADRDAAIRRFRGPA